MLLGLGVVLGLASYTVFDYGWITIRGYNGIGFLDLVLPSRRAKAFATLAAGPGAVPPGATVGPDGIIDYGPRAGPAGPNSGPKNPLYPGRTKGNPYGEV